MLNNSNLPRPYGGVTKTFTATDIAAGFFGFFDTVTTAGVKLFFHNASVGASQESTWAGWVRGHTLSIRWRAPGSSPNAMLITVDGAPVLTPNFPSPTSDSTQTIFKGKTDIPHYLEIRCNTGGYSGTSGPFTSGTVFTVTGSNPSISYGTWGTAWMLTDASFPGIISSAAIARSGAPAGVNVTPANNEITNTNDGGTPANYMRGEGLKIKAQCSEIWLFTGASYCVYSIDGAASVKVYLDDGVLSTHQNATSRSWKRIVVGLDNSTTHDYYIFPSLAVGQSSQMSTLYVMLDSAGTFSAVATTKRVAEFGDSITENLSAATGQAIGTHYIYGTAANLGALGVTRGKGGITVSTLDTDMSSILTAMGFVPDIAVMAIGRNDGATASAAFKASFTSCLNKILANGTNKIICRGVSLGGLVAGSPPARDQDISDAVAAIQASLVGAQAVSYVPTTAWTQPATFDGTHPTEAGYVTMRGNAITDYDATGFFIPSNTAAPSISGSTVGNSLVAGNVGTWTNSPAFTFQWYRSASSTGSSPSVIAGQTLIDYTTSSGAPDQGNYVFLMVTGTTAAGARSVASNVLGPIT